jgi:hypothetical protein
LTQLWEALKSTWASIPVERFLHLVEFMPWWIEAVLRAKGKGVQLNLNIRMVFWMFCTLSIFSHCKLYSQFSCPHYNSLQFIHDAKYNQMLRLVSFPKT